MKSRNLISILLAMAGVFGISSTPVHTSRLNTRREPRETPKPDVETLKAKFFADLKKENERREVAFPNWKARTINGINIIASNPKTAVKQLNYLLKSNGLSLQHIA